MTKDSKSNFTKEDLIRDNEKLRVELESLRNKNVPQISDQDKFDEFIDSVMLPIVVVSLVNATVLYINNSASNYFGIDPVRAIGLSVSKFWVNPKRREDYIKKFMSEGRVEEYEAELVTPHAGVKFVLLSSRKISFNGEKAAYVIFTDITDRKLSEKAYKESEKRYAEMYGMVNSMAETVPVLLWAKDLNDKYLFGNTAIREKLLMCSGEEELIGKNDMFFADRERAAGHVHTFGEICVNSDEVVKKSLKPRRFLEDGHVRGKYLALDVHKAPLFNDKGTLIGTVGAGRDVTHDLAIQRALEDSERRLRLLAENVRDVLWISDTKFNPTYVTPSIETLGGYTPEEFLALPVASHMTPRHKEKFIAIRQLVAIAIKKKEVIAARTTDFECVKKDGDRIWVEIITTPILDNDGSIQGFTGVMRDSTKKVYEQKELTEAKKIALAASQTKSEFLANMSHEIRTPMNGVLGVLQLLKGSNLDSSQQKYVETALASGKSLLHLISDILDFSKIEAGKIELEETPIRITSLLNSVIKSFESLIDKELVTIEYEIAEDVPRCISIDGSRLRQILFNLLGNAIKFTKEGVIKLALHNGGVVDGVISLNFAVIDTGIGISDHIVERIFEPFVQEDGGSQRKYGGTGLGLSIVKKLVEMMEGKVHLRSSIGGDGTTVSFNVMARIEKEVLEMPTARSGKIYPGFDKMRILVVEDEKINAMVISAMLSRLGHTVKVATNGIEALDIICDKAFDCIFMDIQMPEMDGVETTKAIRSTVQKEQKNIPIVALTAHAMKGDKERFISAGMDDYLAKPIEIDSLIGVLQRVNQKEIKDVDQ